MIVRTILGDISPPQLGVTFAHEHLIIDSPLVALSWPHIHLPSVSDAIAEARECADAGVWSMVDAMPARSGGDFFKLAEVSLASGINVIGATGMHTRKYYEGVDWIDDQAEALAVRFINDVVNGIDGHRAGVMKVATSGIVLNPAEERLFQAAGLVHTATGVSIITHCEDGLGGLAQIEALIDAGVEPDSIVLSHTDKHSDRGYQRAILESGTNVEYDQALRNFLVDSTTTAVLVADMWEAGFGSQILLGTDGARRSLWTTLGGAPGLAWLHTGFVSLLEKHGLGKAEIEEMFVTNPARVFSFQPPILPQEL